MIKTSSSTRSPYVKSSLQGFYQSECNIVPLCPLLCAMFLRSKTLLVGHNHLITPNTEFLMGHCGLPFPPAVLWAQTGGMGFCRVTLHRQNMSTDALSISCLPPTPHPQKRKKDREWKGLYQSQILTPNVLVEWLWDGGTFQRPSMCFRERPKLISAAELLT